MLTYQQSDPNLPMMLVNDDAVRYMYKQEYAHKISEENKIENPVVHEPDQVMVPEQQNVVPKQQDQVMVPKPQQQSENTLLDENVELLKQIAT